MKLELSALALSKLLGGTLQGEPNTLVNDLAKIEHGKPGAVSFLSSEKYIPYTKDCASSLLIIDKRFKPQIKDLSNTVLWVDDARQSFGKLIGFIHAKLNPPKKGIHTTALIDQSAKIDSDCFIGPNVVVSKNAIIQKGVQIQGNVFIGEDVTLGSGTVVYSGVNIYDRSKIGKQCVIQSGAIIGSDGFGFAPNAENNYEKIYHLGNVILEDHVEIGANTTIDKATMGSTIIKKGVKLDNLIQIAHNVEIGENTVMAAQCGVAGSTKIGKNCMIGGQVGIVGHIEIADGVKIAAQSGIARSVKKENTILQGSPAFEIIDYKKSYVLFKHLPAIKKQIDGCCVKE